MVTELTDKLIAVEVHIDVTEIKIINNPNTMLEYWDMKDYQHILLPKGNYTILGEFSSSGLSAKDKSYYNYILLSIGYCEPYEYEYKDLLFNTNASLGEKILMATRIKINNLFAIKGVIPTGSKKFVILNKY